MHQEARRLKKAIEREFGNVHDQVKKIATASSSSQKVSSKSMFAWMTCFFAKQDDLVSVTNDLGSIRKMIDWGKEYESVQAYQLLSESGASITLEEDQPSARASDATTDTTDTASNEARFDKRQGMQDVRAAFSEVESRLSPMIDKAVENGDAHVLQRFLDVAQELGIDDRVVQRARASLALLKGELLMSLYWDELCDLDLHVYTPDKKVHTYRNIRQGGPDSYFLCSVGEVVPHGKYEIRVRYVQAMQASHKTPFRVKVWHGSGTPPEGAPTFEAKLLEHARAVTLFWSAASGLHD